jgi:hypothetical protein
MIYFKKVYFNYEDKGKVEAALRKLAKKRTRALDLTSSTSDMGTDKYFFGYDGKNALYFTRIRSSVEFFLPGIIFSLPKNETDFFYKFRLSAVPMIFFLLFCFGFLLSLASALTGTSSFYDFIGFYLLFGLFIALAWLELWITSSKIKKAIIKYHAI